MNKLFFGLFILACLSQGLLASTLKERDELTFAGRWLEVTSNDTNSTSTNTTNSTSTNTTNTTDNTGTNTTNSTSTNTTNTTGTNTTDNTGTNTTNSTSTNTTNTTGTNTTDNTGTNTSGTNTTNTTTTNTTNTTDNTGTNTTNTTTTNTTNTTDNTGTNTNTTGTNTTNSTGTNTTDSTGTNTNNTGTTNTTTNNTGTTNTTTNNTGTTNTTTNNTSTTNTTSNTTVPPTPVVKDYIQLRRTSSGFSFSFNFLGNDNKVQAARTNMLIGLYDNNNVLFSNAFLGFPATDPKTLAAKTPNNTLGQTNNQIANLPYLSVEGPAYTINTSFPSTNTANQASFIIGAGKSGSNISIATIERGIYSFGYGSSSVLSSSNSLSFYLDPNGTKNYVYFGKNANFSKSTIPFLTVSLVDRQWAFTLGGLSVTGASSYTRDTTDASVSYSVGFDINADAIGLPSKLYDYVIASLKTVAAANCTGDIQPTCSINGLGKDLPNIIIRAYSATGSDLNIPSSIYVKSALVTSNYTVNQTANSTNANNTNANSTKTVITSNVTLNIKRLGTTLNGKSYVSPSYQNFIMLDSNFLTAYYTVFDKTSTLGSTYGTISFYEASTSVTALDSYDKGFVAGDPIPVSGKTLIIVIICIVVILVLAGIAGYLKNKNNTQEHEAPDGSGIVLMDRNNNNLAKNQYQV